MPEEPSKPNWRARIVVGVLVLMAGIRAFEIWVGDGQSF
tara:strand:+ start:449 stop:565 length:117 start_codon:yes stop_codon:yes gene_type:complete